MNESCPTGKIVMDEDVPLIDPNLINQVPCKHVK